MSRQADFTAGNVRLRARRAHLLTRGDYDRLAGLPLDRMLGELARTGYGPYLGDTQAAVTPAQARWRLSLAITARMRDALRPVSGFYTGAAADVVGVLLARHDLADLLTLVRGALGGHPAVEITPLLLRVGLMTDTAAADIATAPDAASAVDRAAGHRLPDRYTAAHVAAAWRRHTLHRDPVELELDLARHAVTGWLNRLRAVGPAADPVREVIVDEIDRGNAIAALRRPGYPPDPSETLPPGRLTHGALAEIAQGAATGAALPAEWRRVLDRLDSPGPADVEWRLADRLHHRAHTGWLRGDPLGAAVPVAYVLGVEAEARNLRLLAFTHDPSARAAPVG